jgi:hypothetical protein
VHQRDPGPEKAHRFDPGGEPRAAQPAPEELLVRLGDRVATGTWFQNRCAYLDPSLAWTGVRESGRGCSLSSFGYYALTRPKSFHLRADP